VRLHLRLRANADQKDVSLDYNKLQGFVYRLLQESGYVGIHDKEGYKFFSFSNVFPYGDMAKGNIRHFIFASPNRKIIEAVAGHLESSKNKQFNIGDCSFTLSSFETLDYSLPPAPVKVISATPIIIRIPAYNYDLYNVPETERMPRYIYWRPTISFDAFIAQLSANLVKKYNEYYGTEIDVVNLFEQCYFKKPVHTRLIINGKSYGVAASLWEFSWNYLSPIQKRIIGFALDAGFGERNSFGFGFVNVMKTKSASNSPTP